MSSKRRLRRKGCGSKQRFETQEQAVSTVVQLRRAGKPTIGLQAYRCKFCGKFHFGHRPGSSGLRPS